MARYRFRRPLTLPPLGRLRLSLPRRLRLSPLLITLVFTVITFALIVYWSESRLRPLIIQMAHARVDHLASEVMNQAIEQRLGMDNVQYETLVHFEKDHTGKITALKTDMLAINRLKVHITEDILAVLHNVSTSEITIPLGNIIGGDLFSGRGPSIPVRIVPVGTVTARFSNQFTAAGINQTRHQIILDIEAHMSILMPGDSETQVVHAQVNVAETVIVGAVPDSYINLDGLQGE